MSLIANYIPIVEARDYLPGRPSQSTVSKWINHGIRGRRLKTIRCGNRHFLTADLIADFLETDGGSPPATAIVNSPVAPIGGGVARHA